jgi:peptide/nickel transport system substrate-binding protein
MSLLRKIAKKDQEESDSHSKLNQQILSGMAKSRIPNFKQFKYIKKYLTPKEATILIAALAVFVVSVIIIMVNFYNNNLQTIPERGGSFVEGTVGSPKYINPLYSSINAVDADLAELVFSSLFKRDNNGYLAKDLAKDYTISADQKEYTITIRDDAKWQNGDKVTADDIVFTFNTIKDGQYKSPLRYTFNGVEIERVDDYVIRFKLKESYAPFMEMLTFGIMPSYTWRGITPSNVGLAELNIKPIGSGPYKFKSLTKDKNGNIKEYLLEANTKYYGQVPYIEEITFKFFINPVEAVAALSNGNIDALSYLPFENEPNLNGKNAFNLQRITIPQTTGLFFNLKDGLFKDKKIREALALATNKQALIDNVFGTGAQMIDGPLLPNNFAYTDEITKYSYDPQKALTILNEAGWKLPTAIEVKTEKTPIKDTAAEITAEATPVTQTAQPDTTATPKWLMKNNQELIVQLSVLGVAADMAAAEELAKQWAELGIKTEIKAIDPQNVQNEIITKKNFSVVLYSMLTGVDPDPYPFWHSSQVNALNITGYNNNAVDKLLETARRDNTFDKRKTTYIDFQKKLTADLPAIFLYAPKYTYVQIKKIKGFQTNTVVNPQERFSNANLWYLKEGKRLHLNNNQTNQ